MKHLCTFTCTHTIRRNLATYYTHLIILTVFGEVYKLWILLLCTFHNASCMVDLSFISDTMCSSSVADINQGKNFVLMCVLYSITVKHSMKMIHQWGRLVTACDRSLKLVGENWTVVIQRQIYHCKVMTVKLLSL
jgi:hypothetical protein